MTRNSLHKRRIIKTLKDEGPLASTQLCCIMAAKYRNAPTSHQIGNLLAHMPEVERVESIRWVYAHGSSSRVSLWGLKEGIE